MQPEVFKLLEREKECVFEVCVCVCVCARERESWFFVVFGTPLLHPFYDYTSSAGHSNQKKIQKLVSFSLSHTHSLTLFFSLSLCECQQRNGSKLTSVQMVIKLYFLLKSWMLYMITWKNKRKIQTGSMKQIEKREAE